MAATAFALVAIFSCGGRANTCGPLHVTDGNQVNVVLGCPPKVIPPPKSDPRDAQSSRKRMTRRGEARIPSLPGPSAPCARRCIGYLSEATERRFDTETSTLLGVARETTREAQNPARTCDDASGIADLAETGTGDFFDQHPSSRFRHCRVGTKERMLIVTQPSSVRLALLRGDLSAGPPGARAE